MEIFTQDELVITEAFKEIKPWEGDKLNKWQNYLSNLCMINRMSVIPKLSFPANVVEMMAESHHSVEPPIIYLKSFSVQDLLYHFYNFRSEWTKNEVDHNKAIEYSVGLFYSVWPDKIEKIVFCPENKFIRPIAAGISEALKRNPRFAMKNARLCEEHKTSIPPVKQIHYPGRLHPELN